MEPIGLPTFIEQLANGLHALPGFIWTAEARNQAQLI